MKTSLKLVCTSVAITASVSLLNVPDPLSAQDLKSFACREGKITIVDFEPGTLPFPDGTQLTDHFEKQGIIFSDDDSDLPAFYQSLGAQENQVQQGSFFNLFRLDFTKPVIRASVRFIDRRGGIDLQVHVLAAFDADGNEIDNVFFSESTVLGPSPYPDAFTLSVSSCEGIAFIVAQEQPFGAQLIERIVFVEALGQR